MPIELTNLIESVLRSLGLMPPAILAIGMLAGPTAALVLYRFVAQPRTRRSAADGSDLLWICERCRSANEIRSSRCYRCAMERDEIVGAIQVVDGDGIVTLDPLGDVDDAALRPSGVPVMASASRSRPSVAVGPGPAPAPPAAAARPDLSVDLVNDATRAPVAVGPGKPEPVVARRPRKVVAAARAEAPEPGKTKRG